MIPVRSVSGGGGLWGRGGWLAATVVVAVLSVGGCRRPATRSESATGGANTRSRLHVFVSILPQAYFVERVGGDRVVTDVLVGPGQSPATYCPSPRQMAALERADVYFTIGVPFEQTLMRKIRASLPELRVVDSRRGVTLRWMAPADHHDHAEPGAGTSAHGDEQASGGGASSGPAGTPDPHVWLDPQRVKIIAQNMCEALCSLDPAGATTYRRNLAAFQGDLDLLTARIRALLAPFRGRAFYVFHPAYGYFADAFGLRQVAVEVEGKRPSPRRLERLIEQARADRVRVVVVQPQFATGTAEVIAREIGGEVVPIDPLARDYVKNLDAMAAKIAQALGEREP